VAGASAQRAAALFAWLNRVKRDGSLPASAFKVAFELGQWINGDIFEREAALVAWPSLETLGAAIKMSERTARDMVKRLQLRGHLSIKVGHGPGHPSRYTFHGKTGNLLPLLRRKKPAAGCRFRTSKTGSRLRENRQHSTPKPAAGCRLTI
jgi:hypothetical protein